ncbi:SDR family NAD(P)-dependent oxidoreductase [Pontibacter sp. JAM-7]|uniref:SDR family NAD(P)-dependent oxidoreductase n=1 Tax=Pontibacter sp. JAM-7 TaxID=3366581 RepID=UPI003AF769D5
MNKVAIVSGGSAGIGEAVVKRLRQDGFRVFNLDVSAPLETIDYLSCDMADQGQVQSAVQQVAEQAGRIDVVVANAGVHLSATLGNTSPEAFERVLDINVKGTYYLLHAALPVMCAQKSGSLILMSSDQAIVGKPHSFAYNLSKAALASMAKTTALDYAGDGIRANAVCPGTIETPLYHQAIDRYCQRSGADPQQVHAAEAAEQPLGRIGQPEEVAALVAFLAGDESRFITGSLQVIDGGYTAR